MFGFSKNKINLNKKKITINCDLTTKPYHGSGVGASISCGVDSFYTLLKHNYFINHIFNLINFHPFIMNKAL